MKTTVNISCRSLLMMTILLEILQKMLLSTHNHLMEKYLILTRFFKIIIHVRYFFQAAYYRTIKNIQLPTSQRPLEMCQNMRLTRWEEVVAKRVEVLTPNFFFLHPLFRKCFVFHIEDEFWLIFIFICMKKSDVCVISARMISIYLYKQ